MSDRTVSDVRELSNKSTHLNNDDFLIRMSYKDSSTGDLYWV